MNITLVVTNRPTWTRLAPYCRRINFTHLFRVGPSTKMASDASTAPAASILSPKPSPPQPQPPPAPPSTTSSSPHSPQQQYSDEPTSLDSPVKKLAEHQLQLSSPFQNPTSISMQTSPLPRGESPITQLTKPSRHKGFLSQLLCCFKPTSSNLYHDPSNVYSSNTDAAQHQNSLNLKYSGKYLLPARKPSDNRICLVIDLDETLVHSSFKPIDNADFIVPVEIDGNLHKVYVLKRPHVDEFLKRMGQIYECVLFTASLAKYADPVADLLDKENIFKARLFRESCAFYRGNYVKDLSRLGRDLSRVIIVDNSPASYIFHPDNALPVTSYFDDETDDELLKLTPVLERIAAKQGAVVPICSNN